MNKERDKSNDNPRLSKEERLRAALRANLGRRKQQARERSARDTSETDEQNED